MLTIFVFFVELYLLQSDLSLGLAALLPLGICANLLIGERMLEVHFLVPGSSF